MTDMRKEKREPPHGSSSGRQSPPAASRCVSPGPGGQAWQRPHPATSLVSHSWRQEWIEQEKEKNLKCAVTHRPERSKVALGILFLEYLFLQPARVSSGKTQLLKDLKPPKCA